MSEGKISENIEEYLEVLYRNGSNGEQVSTTKLSKDLGIAPGSVTQMLKKLENLGYIEYTPYKGAVLTNEGMKIAQKITRKHRILEKFLMDVLKIKEENVHEQACEMEHTLSDEAERALCTMLHNPDLCPEENIIPACDFDFVSCKQYIFHIIPVLLKDQLNNQQCTQYHLHKYLNDDELIDDISALNIKVGDNLKYSFNENSIANYYSVIIEDKELNIPVEMANNIFIRI